jgi:hypothetical protein
MRYVGTLFKFAFLQLFEARKKGVTSSSRQQVPVSRNRATASGSSSVPLAAPLSVSRSISGSRLPGPSLDSRAAASASAATASGNGGATGAGGLSCEQIRRQLIKVHNLLQDDVTDNAILNVFCKVQLAEPVIAEVVAKFTAWTVPLDAAADSDAVPLAVPPAAESAKLLVPLTLRKQVREVLVGLLPPDGDT